MTDPLQLLKLRLTTIHHVKDTCAMLSWDQETYMPTGGGAARAEHIATLQTLAHEMFVSRDTETLITPWIDIETGNVSPRATAELDESAHTLLREVWRDFSRAKKLPSTFVTKLERECSLAQQVWSAARTNNDFTAFLPNLRTLVELKLEETEYQGYEDSPYNALLDTYEPGATVAQLQPLFTTMRPRLIALLRNIQQSSRQPNIALLSQSFDTDTQLAFGKTVLDAMGYQFDRGRLDLSAHPFTTSFHPHDVRVTTRVFENDFASCLFSCIHEGGHGLYEQGLPVSDYGTPLGEAVSLGIHESQSRLWENCVGRSRPFWNHFFPRLKTLFPPQLASATFDEFYFAINRVQPSLIRVEADELTYNLHIMVRFDIELDLIEGRIRVDELPDVWNAKIHDYLGITPESDANGVLQDVHWSFGAFGYFPTYTLGNLYASMLYDSARRELPELERHIGEGNMQPLKTWLNEHVHRWGRRFPPTELIQRVTGHAPTPEPFLHYLEDKFGDLYDLPQRS